MVWYMQEEEQKLSHEWQKFKFHQKFLEKRNTLIISQLHYGCIVSVFLVKKGQEFRNRYTTLFVWLKINSFTYFGMIHIRKNPFWRVNLHDVTCQVKTFDVNINGGKINLGSCGSSFSRRLAKLAGIHVHVISLQLECHLINVVFWADFGRGLSENVLLIHIPICTPSEK